jgi:type VI secretion system (T6SS) effector TldE1-like protein
MSTSKVALAGRYRGQSKQANSHRLFSGVAAACLAICCGWTVYSNILASSVYPTLGTTGYDEPIVKLPHVIATRSATQAVSEVFSLIGKPETVAALTPDMFNERFSASEPQSVASNAASAAPPPAAQPPAAPKLAEAPKTKDRAPVQVALAVPPPAPQPVEVKPAAKSVGTSFRDMTQRAKAAVMSIASNDRQTITEKLWGKPAPSRTSLLAFASADASVTGSIPQNPATAGSSPLYDRDTAVYDISAHMVYLPDGSSLEAHSGLGSELDNPRSASIKMRGVTPPHMYELTPREALFHGVPALRLNPVGGEDTIYGRVGLLAHTYMLGPNGDSNGCVSFRDYNAFLNAYRNQGIRKLAVVARVE